MDTPTPISQLTLYRRLFKGRKALFAPSDSTTAPATYFITNPTPHKHASQWKPIFYRGDNPKYTPCGIAIGRARRSASWGTFRLWLGEGVHEVLENERRRRERRKALIKNKFRKMFCRPARPVEVEGETPVVGKVVLVKLVRAAGVKRKVLFMVEGVEYRWSGTRMFSEGWMAGVKGWSHNMKLVRTSDHALIATFEKSRWALWSRPIKTNEPPNKKKQAIGVLKLYDRDHFGVVKGQQGQSKLTSAVAKVDGAISGSTSKLDEKDLNPDGPHSGDLTEDAIVLSCWCVAEAEHRLRHKIEDILQAIGEALGG